MGNSFGLFAHTKIQSPVKTLKGFNSNHREIEGPLEILNSEPQKDKRTGTEKEH